MANSINVGDVFSTNGSGEVVVVGYDGYRKITVQFNDGHTRVVLGGDLRRGEVKNKAAPSVYGVGIFGEGIFKSRDHSRNSSREYTVWKDIIRRCYDTKSLERNPTYSGCTVCDSWLNFQNFAAWYTTQKGYEEGWQVDKDLSILGNKVYSPDTCTLIPNTINTLLCDCKASRGNNPQGVHYHTYSNKFVAQLSKDGVSQLIGHYSTQSQAFTAYKVAKEAYVKHIADKYKCMLPDVIYNNLLRYVVLSSD